MRTITLNVIKLDEIGGGYAIESVTTEHYAEGVDNHRRYTFPEWYATRGEAEVARRHYLEDLARDGDDY